MLNRALEIAQMMGYEGIDAILDAVGRGELILLKVPDAQRLEVSQWIRERIPEVRGGDRSLADASMTSPTGWIWPWNWSVIQLTRTSVT